MTLSINTRRAIRKYSATVCLSALIVHERQGFGAAGIANGHRLGLVLSTTRAADAAINAGRELSAALR